MLLEISIVFFIISVLFKIFRPTKRNFLYGYRTPLSKSSQLNWDEAQRYSSTIFIIVSIILFTFAIIFEFTKLPYEQLSTIMLIFGAIISIFIFTEQHLKKFQNKIIG
ncbi:MAG: SdpI family protein [Clostridium sp.]|uniref:SdpI family protein n=1 Tax=Clostridium sp. TaxID=1506 RepID=UPI003F3D8DEA